MSNAIKVLGVISLLLELTLGYPSPSSANFTVFKDPDNGLKYFWHPDQNGELVKAYLEGGPPPVKVANDQVSFYLFTKLVFHLRLNFAWVEILFFFNLMHFFLRNNPSIGHELRPNCPSCIANSNFNPSAPVKIVCHGFMSDYQSDVNSLMRDGLSPNFIFMILWIEYLSLLLSFSAYLRRNEFINIIIVDWKSLAAAPWYELIFKC